MQHRRHHPRDGALRSASGPESEELVVEPATPQALLELFQASAEGERVVKAAGTVEDRLADLDGDPRVGVGDELKDTVEARVVHAHGDVVDIVGHRAGVARHVLPADPHARSY